MNTQNLPFIVRDDVTVIECRFPSSNPNSYSFIATKALAAALEEGDYVVVVANGKSTQYTTDFTIVQFIEETGPESIDPDTKYRYQWAVQRVDTELHDQLQSENKRIAAHIAKCKRRSVRDQVLASLGVDNTDIANILEPPKDSTSE